MVKPVRIVCEGKSDKKFLEKLLDHLGIVYTDTNFQILGSKSKILDHSSEKFTSLKKSVASEEIEKIFVVLDSDSVANDTKLGGFSNSEKVIKEFFDNFGYQNIGSYCVVCDPATREGYLESLVYSTLSDDDKKCIENFLECSRFSGKEHHKAIINQVYELAYPDKPFDFSHSSFDELKDKLKQLFS